jgi:hypothetical protein
MLLNFKTQFVPKILAKRKRHTIRAKRKYAPRVGEICHCYTGLRRRGPMISKTSAGKPVYQKVKARLLGRWTCVKVQEIAISADCNVWIDGIRLKGAELGMLAQSDGFNNFAEMMQFWEGRLPFCGDIIHWDPN